MDQIDSEQPLQSCSNNNKNTVINGDGINGTNAKCMENKRIHNEDLLDQVKQDFDSLKDIQNFNRIGSKARINSRSYFLPVKLDDTVIITANVLKVGRNVAFAECEFRRKSDGKLTAKGKHTVAILPNAPPVTASGQIIQY
ncbi:hypothetical protein WR25_02139 [Diploscapter pachys]|uniref:Thioesterase domain-containing protein n=1 Tax=Diploscapter pachys TaxID=2018661 RepID=A0A2A2K573_9BILA|nr:hypothetical protein WR25_02139 [Diploscapter pachys]